MFTILSTCKGGGYRYARTDPPHPRQNAKGLYPLHIVLMENKLGRLLQPGETVHHRDEDKANDDPDNLEVIRRGPHASLHNQERMPDPVDVECPCGRTVKMKPHVQRYRAKRNVSGKVYCSRRCGGQYKSHAR